jgi:hypothetical protein
MTLFRFALMALAMLLAVPTVQAQMLGMSLISTTSAGLIYSAGISVTTNQTSVTSLYASGNVAITGNTSASIISVTAIQVVSQSSSPVTCNSGNSGALRYNSPTTALQLCTGSGWQTMGVGIPAGTIAAFASTTCPTGWSEYTAARGAFLRGIDNGAGIDPSGTRTPGSFQGDLFKSHTHAADPACVNCGGTGSSFLVTYTNSGSNNGWSSTTSSSGGAETRPVNVAVTFCQFNGTSNGWNNPLSGGSTSAAGNTSEVQYNGGSGAFGSSSNFTYNNGAGLLTAPNISTSNISVSTINGTPVGSLGSASKLASLTDVDVSGKVSGSVLVYNGGTTSWTTLPIQNVMSTTTMFTGWPDAIVCNVTAPTALGNAVFFAELMPYVSGLYYYRNHTNGTNFDIIFNSNGSFNSYSGITSANCNTTISSLYSSGRAFNFIGGSNANDSIVSGTTGLTAISNTNTISITTNNVVTGYFNSNGVLTVPGISATSNLTSVTTLYASGNVGIGTTTPGMPLEVAGASASGQLRLRNTGAGAKYWNIGADGSNNITVYSHAGTGVYVANGATSWSANSDRRIKTNIQTLTHDQGLGAIEKIRPVSFNWRDPNASKTLQVGVIAQDVQKVLPELITVGSPTANTPSGTLGVQYTGLIAPLIKAVQELKADNDHLRADFEDYKRTHP